jgi:hypothetical protein
MMRLHPITVLGGLLLALGCDSGSNGAAVNAGGRGGVTAAAGAAGGAMPGASGGAAGIANSAAGGSYGGQGGSTLDPTGMPVMPMEPVAPRAYLRKVKGLLTGLAPTETEAQSVASAADPKAALATLIDTWTSSDHMEFYGPFRDQMIFFFTNAFQQKGFTPTEDFKHQLLENAGFDLGPFGVYGDDAFPRLVQNLQESFARTAWDIVSNQRPFTDVLTTRQFMMTTALMSLYEQIEMPNDQPYAFAARGTMPLGWKVDFSGNAIPLEQTLDSTNANYMVFDDQPPMNPISFQLSPTCQGMAQVNAYTGYSQLFQRLFGFTPRYPYVAQPMCWEHASLPYYTTSDLTDWRPVTLHALGAGEARIQPYDLPSLRKANALGLTLPRVGFYTTPAYLALWNTNDSNQHRVTANQTLLVALGAALTSDSEISPVSTVGLDSVHAVMNTECYGCHKVLDPLRQFWANEFDFNDRNDFPAFVFNGIANPRPTTKGGVLAAGDVNANGATIADLGGLLAKVNDTSDQTQPINQFAIAFTQKLCFFADSAPCAQSDPEFRRVALAFQNSKFDFKTLIHELFSSPLVTGASNTMTFQLRDVVVSVARRDQLCESLSTRLGRPDLCALSVAFPFQSGFGFTQPGSPYAAQRAIFRIASSLPADGFSRGSETPVTSPDPTLFYRAGSEMVCETVAAAVVDGSNPVYTSSNLDQAMDGMVQQIMGYASGDPHYAQALQILKSHYQEALTGHAATDALRSTFSLACESPTSLSFGL